MATHRGRVVLAALTIVGVAVVGPSAGAAGACSRLADHRNDVTDGGGRLLTDQDGGGRLDILGASFTREATDVTVELTLDDLTGERGPEPLTTYWVYWSSGNEDIRLDIADDDGVWSFSGARGGDLFTTLFMAADGRSEVAVDGVADEQAGTITVTAHDALAIDASNLLTEVVVASSIGQRLFFSTPGDDIPNRNSKTTVDLGADCTSAPDPLRAWCNDVTDPAGDARPPLVGAAGVGGRIDMTTVSLRHDARDLIARFSLADLEANRAAGANAARYWLDLEVAGSVLSVNAYEIDGSWVSTAERDGSPIAADIHPGPGASEFTVTVDDVLVTQAPRYVLARFDTHEGVGAITSAGPVFHAPWTMPWDYAEPPTPNQAYLTAIDLDVDCPWDGR